MELISLIVESILAILALIIAVLQLIGESRTRKEELKEKERQEQKKEVMRTVLENARDAEKFSACILDFKSTIDTLSQRQDNHPVVVLNMFDAIDEYEDSFNKAKPSLISLYDALLANEEKFPMAYGYGRYIEGLRQVLNFDALVRERKRNGYDKARLDIQEMLQQKIRENNNDPTCVPFTMDLRLYLGQQVSVMVRALEPYYAHAELIRSILYELGAKYAHLDAAPGNGNVN